jgi:hypothetical protein
MTSSRPSAVPPLVFSDDDVTFFTIGDHAFFPGVAGLVNSLRVLGHTQRIVIADCGFTAPERHILEPHATLIPLSRADVKNPQQYKAFPFLVRPRGIVAIVDSDIIVTALLDGVLASARDGKIVVFPDPEERRWFAEWQDIFGLPGAPRRQTYVNSGFVVFSSTRWSHLLEHWWHACERIFHDPTIREGAARNHPTSQSDQDAFNALLMSEVAPDAIALQPKHAMVFRWDFERVRVEDESSLRCDFEGTRVVALHAVAGPKSWQRAAAGEATTRNAYVRLLRRLLVGSDAAVRVPASDVPVWLRPGFAGRLSLAVRSVLPRNTGLVARARQLVGRA